MLRLIVALATGAAVVALSALGVAPAQADGFVPAPDSPYATGGSGPYGVAVGDLNNDVKPDVVVGHTGSGITGQGQIAVLLGDGSGRVSLAPGSPLTTGGSLPIDVAVGHFNADTNLDVVAANSESHNVSLLLGNGTGGLSPAAGSPFATNGNLPVNVIPGDFNGDGNLDVAAVHSRSNDVAVLLGSGSGTLTPASSAPFPSGGDSPHGADVADFNGDGKSDVAVANANTGTVGILLGSASGLLAPSPGGQFPNVGSGASGVAAGDFDRDGNPDVAVANSSRTGVALLLGDGNGHLGTGPGSPFATGGSSPIELAAGDFDGDQNPDLAVSNHNSDNVSVLLGDGHGRFAPAPNSPYGTGAVQPTGVAVGDLNGDLKPDIAVANVSSSPRGLSVLLNDLAGNQPPDCSGGTATPRSLWPPNGRLVTVRIDGATDPDGEDVQLTIDGVTQDEPVRRRSSAFTASDGRGGECSGIATVEVRRHKNRPAIDSAPPSYDSLGQ